MNIVKPESKTTLLLNANFMPINVATARMTFNHVITGRVKPIDRFGMPHGFPEDQEGKLINDINQHYWFLLKDVFARKDDDGNEIPYDEAEGIYYKDQPLLRSAQHLWPVPTIALTTTRFFRYKANGKVTIQKLAKFYKNICQICGEHFPTSELTIEHVIPRAKDGITDDSNCLPTCKVCNSQKADIWPYFDSGGVPLQEKIRAIPNYLVTAGKEHRPEWEQYGLFKQNHA